MATPHNRSSRKAPSVALPGAQIHRIETRRFKISSNNQNIITQVEYDKAGRRAAMRDPRGKRTTYAYDALDRRTRLTDPRGSTWTTAYTPLRDGTLRMVMTDPLSP